MLHFLCGGEQDTNGVTLVTNVMNVSCFLNPEAALKVKTNCHGTVTFNYSKIFPPIAYCIGVVPSVSFVADIPKSPHDSFYQGKAYMCLKDKVTPPSSPLRHSTELASLLLRHYSDDGLVPTKPVLVVVSDGRPDHRNESEKYH